MKEWRKNSVMKNRWPAAYKIIDELEQAGFEAFVVGGAVRDFVRNAPVNDVDITTNATPNEVKEIFMHTIDVGIEHGTVLVVLDEPIEVTTYRSESTYTDFRRPDGVTFVRTLKEDLQRRDFTINAMALTKEDELVDYFGGRQAIEEEIIQAVGNPELRFSEDALRMLRAVRFSAQLNFSLEQNTLHAIQSLHALISHVSIERVKVELEKMWLSDCPFKGMQLFVDSGLSSNFPGSWKMGLQSWNDFASFNVKANGWAFFALQQKEEVVHQLLNHFKCSNDEKRHVKNVVQAVHCLVKGAWTADELFHYSEEVLSVAYHYGKSILSNEIPDSLEEFLLRKRAIPIASKKDIVINGNDLMQWANQKRGPWIKEVLDILSHMIVNGEITNDRQEIKGWFSHEYLH
ncbi:CCA tRNA nucleotidyltransferase [Psychrobacillus antarcticus]|uniref:CCA tRNA nucleotidyltransferase n=1 Tax=Psychrobacillus antarcticus TaxID=2879115 RepID=UPI0024085868|nr:CCA tRNA nucleotidyltransferase [Psychrobacillus antarcticus]